MFVAGHARGFEVPRRELRKQSLEISLLPFLPPSLPPRLPARVVAGRAFFRNVCTCFARRTPQTPLAFFLAPVFLQSNSRDPWVSGRREQGIPGMILAVPMVVITRIVCDHLDHPYAKGFMRLLEGNVFEVCFLFAFSLV